MYESETDKAIKFAKGVIALLIVGCILIFVYNCLVWLLLRHLGFRKYEINYVSASFAPLVGICLCAPFAVFTLPAKDAIPALIPSAFGIGCIIFAWFEARRHREIYGDD